jgi:hypothetical protein
MQITALIQAVKFLKEKSVDPSLIGGYSRLSELTGEDPGNRDADFWQTVKKEKEQLCNLLIESDPSDWGYAKYSLFEKIDSDKLFGKPAARFIENLLAPGKEDLNLIHSELLKKTGLITSLSETLTSFLQLYDKLLPSDILPSDKDAEEDLTMLLYFEEQLSVKTIQEMERFSRLWNGILNSFYTLTGEANLDLDIINFNEGNFTLGVAAGEKMLKSVMTGVVGIISSLPLILQIRKTQIEIGKLPLRKDINVLLEEEIQTLINLSALDLANDLISEYYDGNFDREAMTNDISRSLKQMLNFVEKGGKFEFRPRVSSHEFANSNKILNDSYALAIEINRISERSYSNLGKDDKLNDKF